MTLLEKAHEINDAIERMSVDDLVAHYADDIQYVTRLGTVQGREAFQEYYTTMFASIRDVVCRITWAIESGDTVAEEVQFEATYIADGKRIVVPVMAMVRFRDGLVVEEHEYLDTKEIERQIERQLLERELPEAVRGT